MSPQPQVIYPSIHTSVAKRNLVISRAVILATDILWPVSVKKRKFMKHIVRVNHSRIPSANRSQRTKYYLSVTPSLDDSLCLPKWFNADMSFHVVRLHQTFWVKIWAKFWVKRRETFIWWSIISLFVANLRWMKFNHVVFLHIRIHGISYIYIYIYNNYQRYLLKYMEHPRLMHVSDIVCWYIVM